MNKEEQMPVPLLLLSGLLNDARVWDPVRAALPPGRTVVCARTDTADTVEALAASALASMPAGPIAVAGFSLGGYVALEVCRQAPERIVGIALLDTGARADTPESQANRQRMIDAVASGQASGDAASFETAAQGFAARVLHPSNASNPDMLDLLASMARAVGAEGFVRQQTAAMHRPDARDVLGRLECPALVLCGADDQTTPPALSEEMAGLLPGDVELVLVPHAAHMSTLEQPDAVVDAFLRWVKRVDGAGQGAA